MFILHVVNDTEPSPSLICPLQFYALDGGSGRFRETLGKVALAFSAYWFYAPFCVENLSRFDYFFKKPHKLSTPGFLLPYLLLKMADCVLTPAFLSVWF